jgi:hypothetical protein
MQENRYADIAGQEIVFQTGDGEGIDGETRLRIKDVELHGGVITVNGWPLNSYGWPDGRERKLEVPKATFDARRLHR